MSTKIDANRDSLEAAYKWQALKVNPLLLMVCIVVPAFVGSYFYTSWQQTKNLKQSSNVEIKYLPVCSGEGSESRLRFSKYFEVNYEHSTTTRIDCTSPTITNSNKAASTISKVADGL